MDNNVEMTCQHTRVVRYELTENSVERLYCFHHIIICNVNDLEWFHENQPDTVGEEMVKI